MAAHLRVELEPLAAAASRLLALTDPRGLTPEATARILANLEPAPSLWRSLLRLRLRRVKFDRVRDSVAELRDAVDRACASLEREGPSDGGALRERMKRARSEELAALRQFFTNSGGLDADKNSYTALCESVIDSRLGSGTGGE